LIKEITTMSFSIDEKTTSSPDDSTRSSLLDVSCHSIKSCLAVKTHRDSLMDMSSRSDRSCSCRSVRFHTVEFREYPVILCDNPSASGPPIGLGWEYDPEDTLQAQVDDYEAHRHEDDRRTKSGLRIPPNIREDKLLQAGFSRSEIRSVVQMSEKEKERRRSSLLRKQRIGPILKGVENIKLGFKRSMSLPSLRPGKNDCSSQDSDFLDASQDSDFLDRTNPPHYTVSCSRSTF
jgi:hypothetical protein